MSERIEWVDAIDSVSLFQPYVIRDDHGNTNERPAIAIGMTVIEGTRTELLALARRIEELVDELDH